jgi:hypothetical protein
VPAWLWSQNSEHRLPVPRLVNLGLLRATGDFRATMLFDALILGAVTAGMIVIARRLHGGRTRLEDAFFPLLLLQLGNWDNLVWAWQIQYVLPTVLACVILLVIVARRGPPAPWGMLIGALALIALPLSGANGLVVTPPLAAWFAWQPWVPRDGSATPFLRGGSGTSSRRRLLHRWLPGAACTSWDSNRPPGTSPAPGRRPRSPRSGSSSRSASARWRSTAGSCSASWPPRR